MIQSGIVLPDIKVQQININLWLMYTSDFDRIFKDDIFVMLTARVATDTIRKSRINVMAPQ